METPSTQMDTDDAVAILQEIVDKRIFIDISKVAEERLGMSRERFMAAVGRLMKQGYVVHSIHTQQAGTKKQMIIKVMAVPGITQQEVWINREKVQELPYIL